MYRVVRPDIVKHPCLALDAHKHLALPYLALIGAGGCVYLILGRALGKLHLP